jgi:hypothetical protein
MPIENQNKTMQEKLDEMNQLPTGFHFQQQAVWNKLEASLQNKQQKLFLPRWARIAAAIMIISLIGSWLFFTRVQKSNAIVINNPGTTTKQHLVSQNKSTVMLDRKNNFGGIIKEKLSLKKEFKNSNINQQTQKSQDYVNTNNIKQIFSRSNTKNKLTINSIIGSDNKNKTQPIPDSSAFNKTTTVQTIELTSVLTTEKPLPAVVPNNSKTADIAAAVTSFNKPVQKRLPVIHINELGREAQPIYLATNTKHASLVEKEEPNSNSENNKTWWWPKPKPATITPAITTLTDNQ